MDEFHTKRPHERESNNYTPAYIRIAQNQLKTLQLSFKRIIIEHNSDSIDYQNDLKLSLRNSTTLYDSCQQISRTTTNEMKNLSNEDMNMRPTVAQEQMQLQISQEKQQHDVIQQEMEIVDLEARLENIRILKERVRQMK